MRREFFMIALLAVVLYGGLAWAKGKDGFSGTAFGTPRTALPTFMTLKKLGSIEYAVNLNEHYRLNGHAPVVFYGFADGRLFAAYVRLDQIATRDAMAKRLRADFGKPHVSVEGGTEIFRWRKGDLKVKLKFDPAAGSLKLAYYSIANGAPAARVLAEPDAVDMDELARIYDKNKITKGVSTPALPTPKGYSPYQDGVAAPVGRNPGQ